MTQEFKIGLDASYDLYAAGFVNDETQVDAFQSEYVAQAARYAAEHGMSIDVVCGSGAQLQGCDTSEEAASIWQAIHDAVSWTGPRRESIDTSDIPEVTDEMMVSAVLRPDTRQYVVIDDGAFRYPMLIADLDGQTQESLRAMSGPDAYSLWCAAHPMDASHGTVGSQGCIDFCADLERRGAAIWYIA